MQREGLGRGRGRGSQSEAAGLPEAEPRLLFSGSAGLSAAETLILKGRRQKLFPRLTESRRVYSLVPAGASAPEAAGPGIGERPRGPETRGRLGRQPLGW